MKTPIYSGKLNPKELIDWIRDMETLFDMEQTEEGEDGMYEVEGHASLWWNNVQLKIQRECKDKIKTWIKWWLKSKVDLPMSITL